MIGDGQLKLQPISQREAFRFIALHHRHHDPPRGFKFAIGLNDRASVIGVITVGRPVARHLDDTWTAEVTRCCVLDGHKNAASKLYAAAWRAARAMGYERLLTYTLASEPGTSLRAAGWRIIGETAGGSWSRPSRPRVDTHPLGQKILWEVVA
jgi:hypothetical protein